MQFGNTALHEAAKLNHADIVVLLLQHDASVNIKNRVTSVSLDGEFAVWLCVARRENVLLQGWI